MYIIFIKSFNVSEQLPEINHLDMDSLIEKSSQLFIVENLMSKYICINLNHFSQPDVQRVGASTSVYLVYLHIWAKFVFHE